MEAAMKHGVRKIAAASGLSLALIFGAAACGSSTSSSSADAGSSGSGTGGGVTIDGIKWPVYKGNTTLTVWTWAGAPQTTEVVPQFEKIYPNIKVNVENVGAGSELYSKLATANTAGSGEPDVVMLEYPYIPEFVQSKAITSISSYVQPFLSQLPKWATSAVTFNGQVYNMPFGGGTLGLIYRSSVLAQYHLPVPTTWATFASDAEALHKDNPNEYMTYFPNNDGEYVLSLLQQAGANPFTDNNGNWTIDLDSPAAQKVMTYWGNLIKQGDIAVQSDFTPAWQHSIATGQYAAYVGPDWFPSAVLVPYVKAGSESFTVTTMPQWTAGEDVTANNGGSGYSVTSQSPNKQAGALFAAFMDLGGANTSMAAGSLPVVSNPAQFPAYTTSKGTQTGFTQNLNKIYQDFQPDVSSNFTFSPWTTELNNDLNAEIAKAVAGSEPWSDVLKNTQNELAQYVQGQGYNVTVG
jgi:multiple sugar transport system substrate-binding protein